MTAMKKRQEQEDEEELEDEDKYDTAEADKLSTVEKHMLTISKTLKKLCEKTRDLVTTYEESEKVKRWIMRSSIVVQSKITYPDY